MKHLITIAAVACAFALNAATAITLHPGRNEVNACGEIVGIECMTVGASASVTASVVTAVTEYTNAYKSVTSRHTRYDFVITNFDGNAAISTNTLDRFNYADWQTTNGVSKIVGNVTAHGTNISEQVVDGQRAKATYTKTAAIGSGSASSHYLKITPASTFHFYGGRIDIEANEQDIIKVLIK